MAEYQQLTDSMTGDISDTILRRVDGAFIPNDPANRDYQEYLTWLDQGNTPDPPQVATESADVSSQDQG
jgi:hypothetical protein